MLACGLHEHLDFLIGLPWQSGARFFMQHLFTETPHQIRLAGGGLPVSRQLANTMWPVPVEIEQFTNGRFSPHNLNETPLPVVSSKTYEIMPEMMANIQKNIII